MLFIRLMAALTIWLLPEPALAYLSKDVQLENLSYRLFATIDPDCHYPLEESGIERLQTQLETSPLITTMNFRGCFAAVFDVEVHQAGTFSFINNGYIQKMAVVKDGNYREAYTFYENDAVVADLELAPGRYRIYSAGKGLGQMTANRWGLGNAPYWVQPSALYHHSSFLITALRGICLGVLGIMAVFFLFMTRENNRVFLIYGTFITINILFTESMRSLTAELLGFRGGQYYFAEWKLVAQLMGTLGQLVMGIFFAAFYEVKKLHPRYYRVFLVQYALILLEIPIVLLQVPYGYLYTATVILTGTLTLLVMALWFSIKRGGIYHLMLIGYGIMLSGTQYFVVTAMGFVEMNNIWGRDVHLIGSTIEVILFSIATSLKLNNKFAKQKKENDHVLQQLQKIVYPHQLQKIREGSSLEQTMPTGKTEACVMAFDIIGSSRIQHEKVKDFVERAIELCIANMYERYDAERLAADAYRIKVVGDGFLCSIGFPFRTPDSIPVGEAAVRLAMRMVQTFSQVEKEFNYHEPIYCAIGLAHGSIEAYYPQIGTKEYDLYGSAIVLATRYEQLRKQLFSPENANYIILHERVYETLGQDLQGSFACIDLVKRQIRVRDDDQAHRVYVWQSSERQEAQSVA
ncbi:MAG: adenylate/guanylate cyclase domain-containing protein [Pseudobdellovibrionaceae bacterium]|nr:adenylate/guanylate cyclase domain-containing protein [Pseudobdellovibrionaceae bacterium]